MSFFKKVAKNFNKALDVNKKDFNRSLDVNRKNFNKALPGLRTIGAAGIGGMIAGPLGALAGAAAAAPKSGQQSGGGGAAAGTPGAPAAPSGPQLSPWIGIESLKERGTLTPSLVTSKAIQEEMEASPWFKMALERQGLEESKQRGAAEQQMATQAAQARGLLASRGGLRGGSAERLASQSAENLALARQGILGQGAEARADLGMKGLGLASDIVGRNVSAENVARQQNVQNAIEDLRNQNLRNLEQYREEMKLKGAEATSEGIRKSGGGGGFFQNPVKATQATFKNLGF